MTRQYNKKNRVVFKAYVVPNKTNPTSPPPLPPPIPPRKQVKMYISKFDALFYLFILAMVIWSPSLLRTIGWGVAALGILVFLIACYWGFYKFVSKKVQ